MNSQVTNWAHTYGSTSSESASHVRTDSQGNVFVVGSFSETVDFDPGSGMDTRTSAGNGDAFVVQLNGTVNIEEHTRDEVRIFPNPASTYLIIQSENANSEPI
ncbi:hypothetical protein N9355_09970, partial [Crocinitomicaceae bacterium]|nr:hypothetical protein [Crocinitomicaceae bacterium]